MAKAKRNLDALIAASQQRRRPKSRLDALSAQDKADARELIARGMPVREVTSLIQEWTGIVASDKTVREYLQKGRPDAKKAK